MNTRQYIVIGTSALALLAMIFFPPFEFHRFDGAIINEGYGFLFAPPEDGQATVAIATLLSELIALLIIAVTAFILFERQGSSQQSDQFLRNRYVRLGICSLAVVVTMTFIGFAKSVRQISAQQALTELDISEAHDKVPERTRVMATSTFDELVAAAKALSYGKTTNVDVNALSLSDNTVSATTRFSSHDNSDTVRLDCNTRRSGSGFWMCL